MKFKLFCLLSFLGFSLVIGAEQQIDQSKQMTNFLIIEEVIKNFIKEYVSNAQRDNANFDENVTKNLIFEKILDTLSHIVFEERFKSFQGKISQFLVIATIDWINSCMQIVHIKFNLMLVSHAMQGLIRQEILNNAVFYEIINDTVIKCLQNRAKLDTIPQGLVFNINDLLDKQTQIGENIRNAIETAYKEVNIAITNFCEQVSLSKIKTTAEEADIRKKIEYEQALCLQLDLQKEHDIQQLTLKENFEKLQQKLLNEQLIKRQIRLQDNESQARDDIELQALRDLSNVHDQYCYDLLKTK